MRFFSTSGFIFNLDELDSLRREAGNAVRQDGMDSRPNDQWKQQLQRLLKKFLEHCDALQFNEAEGRIYELQNRLGGLIRPDSVAVLTFQVIESELQGLQNAIDVELAHRKFAYIPTQKADFFEQDALLGESVSKAFPSAQADIKDAGNCLAADLHTAAAFHLMRIVEIGLREFAQKLKIKISKTPLDYAGWKSVVQAIDAKLSAKIPKARGPKQAQALQFKHDLLADFKSFEMKRNEIMHCRWRCNEGEAMGLFVRVRDFMQRLAARIST
ncbi:MAG: hypothetical protein ACLQAH_08480 [Limisphaerales bacterium]